MHLKQSDVLIFLEWNMFLYFLLPKLIIQQFRLNKIANNAHKVHNRRGKIIALPSEKKELRRIPPPSLLLQVYTRQYLINTLHGLTFHYYFSFSPPFFSCPDSYCYFPAGELATGVQKGSQILFQCMQQIMQNKNMYY